MSANVVLLLQTGGWHLGGCPRVFTGTNHSQCQQWEQTPKMVFLLLQEKGLPTDGLKDESMPALVMSLCVAENADGNWDTVYATKWDQLWSLIPGPLQDISVGSKQKIPSHPW